VAIVGVDLDQKGMQMPQRYGAASSYGKKYALGNLFLIDDTQDADATNTHGKKQTITQKAISTAQLIKAKEYTYLNDKPARVQKANSVSSSLSYRRLFSHSYT
jgi:hypothetical protein